MQPTPDPGTASQPRRVPENAPPPLWLGLMATAIGVVIMIAFFQESLVAAGVGVLFTVLGLALTLTSITAARNRHARRATRAAGEVALFTRSPMRILVDLVLAPIGALAFFAFAVFMLSQGPFGWIGTAGFGFFGVLMLLGAVVTVRRGVRRTVVEVGPDGLWTPELPRRLAWSEIERMEAEASVGAAGEAGLAVYHRLGIWPRDASLADAAPGRSAGALVRGVASFTNQLAAASGRDAVRLSDPAQMAPFGINAFEIEQDFEDLLRAVGRYLPVGGVEQPAGASDGPAPLSVEPRLVPPAPPLEGMAGAILDEYAGAAARPPTILRRRRPPPEDVALIDAPPPDPAPQASEPAHAGDAEAPP